MFHIHKVEQSELLPIKPCQEATTNLHLLGTAYESDVSETHRNNLFRSQQHSLDIHLTYHSKLLNNVTDKINMIITTGL